MKKITRKGLLSGLAVLPLATLLAGCPPAENKTDDSGTVAPNSSKPANVGTSTGKKLVIAWADWDPAVKLQTLTEDYTKETGTTVEVKKIPWSDFETKINAAWTGQSDEFDLIVGDSQWLGKAATSGHYVDLTEWMNDGANFPKADNEEAAVKNYGEYEGKMYAVPCMADAIGFAYRKDLFEDEKNKTAFKTKYNRDLAVPTTWDEFQQVAEFFTRPDEKLYGCILFYSKEYDGATMGFDQVLWAFGGSLDKINSPEAVKALEFYAGLKKFCPPGAETAYFQESNTAFSQGQVAMAENWFAFFPALVDPKQNKLADKTGYFMVPKGPAGQFVSLGGQGLSLSAYSKQQDEAKKFMAWFSKEDTQKKWVALGGLTANKKVSATEEFKKANPYNETFAKSVPFLKDFYNKPQYTELTQSAQKNLNAAIAGTTPPKDALDTIAKDWETALAQK